MSYTPSGSVDGHTLTIAEMPSHNHTITSNGGWGDGPYNSSKWRTDMNSPGNPWGVGTINNTGGGRSHSHGFTGTAKDINVLQPYLSVFMWKRTA